MILQIVTVLGVLLAAVGDQQFICQKSIWVREGDAAILRCHWDPKLPLDGYTVEVRRADLPEYDNNSVLLYRDGRVDSDNQLPQYKNRPTLDQDALKEGTVKVNISSVNESDSGCYVVIIRKLRIRFFINVTVEPKSHDSIITSAPKSDDSGGEKWKLLWIIAAVVLVGGLLLFYLRRRKKRCNCVDSCEDGRRSQNGIELVAVETEQTAPGGDSTGPEEASNELMVNGNSSRKSCTVY